MAVNPLHFLKLKDRYHIFREEHPKFIPYLKMLGEKAAEEGTILEVKAITKDGKEVSDSKNYYAKALISDSSAVTGAWNLVSACTSYTQADTTARNNGFEGGLSDPELTPDILAILAGESLKVCKDAMELNRQRAVSLEEICENGFTPSIGESPESAYIKKEKTELLREQIKKLNPLEVFICEHFIMADDKKRKCLKNDYTKGSKDSINEDDCKWSLKRFADYFGVPEHFKKYADYLPKNGKVDANFLKRTINHVTMLLRCDKKLKSCGGINDAGREIIDQASFDDIESAVLGGLLMEDTIPV